MPLLIYISFKLMGLQWVGNVAHLLPIYMPAPRIHLDNRHVFHVVYEYSTLTNRNSNRSRILPQPAILELLR